jgi:hypothetical protein
MERKRVDVDLLKSLSSRDLRLGRAWWLRALPFVMRNESFACRLLQIHSLNSKPMLGGLLVLWSCLTSAL